MEINIDQMAAWIGDFFWPFIRLGALFIASPIFGARTVPVKIRIILALAVTVIIQPSLPFSASIEPFSAEGLVIIFQQIAIGLVMGLTLQIMFASLVIAGQAMATTMGLGFASSVDPQNGIQVTMLGQFYLIVATLLFLTMDGHLLALQILADSFQALPIQGSLFSAEIFWNVCMYSSQMFIAALLISMPVMVGVLLVNLGFGVITRAAPQLNVFSLGFPITMVAGFTLMFLSLPVIFPVFSDLFTQCFEFLSFVVNSPGI